MTGMIGAFVCASAARQARVDLDHGVMAPMRHVTAPRPERGAATRPATPPSGHAARKFGAPLQGESFITLSREARAESLVRCIDAKCNSAF
ncbi:hypothetical protein [Paraburkholderia sp. J94]|uniref:hypothetical protein n=1 Tax=Paraburkholderia sp. J94 TaxID=2805441 RepID=UPI002AB2300F|nr:hypothetical protein [Paraburkholderia sp. J94]